MDYALRIMDQSDYIKVAGLRAANYAIDAYCFQNPSLLPEKLHLRHT